MNCRVFSKMPDHFCIVSDHAKLNLVLKDIMSVQQQIVIIISSGIYLFIFFSCCLVGVNKKTA